MNHGGIFPSNMPSNFQQYNDSQQFMPSGMQGYPQPPSGYEPSNQYNVWECINQFHVREDKLERVRKYRNQKKVKHNDRNLFTNLLF